MGLFDFFKNKNKDNKAESTDESVISNIQEELQENTSEDTSDVPAEEICENENIAESAETGDLENTSEEQVIEETSKEIAENTEKTEIQEAEETEITDKTDKAEIEPVQEETEEVHSGQTSADDENIEETENNSESEPEMDAENQPESEAPKKGFFARLKEGLGKTRKNILGSVDSVLGAFTKIDEDLFEELEEALIMADLGVQTTMDICDNLRKRVKKENVTDPSKIKDMLCEEISAILTEGCEEEFALKEHTVMLVIGVNGVGKTTTIGKLASVYKKEGKSVMLAAADTFRAAAIDQLMVWGKRCGVDVIKHEENSDPAAVVFDAANAAKNRKTDILICDTAGRLHNKKNLMEELKKISKVIEREYPEANKEVFLVLDATTGQNALQQAKLFKEVTDITGIILTKLDGTAKGGIVVAIKSELQIPVRYIGVGEGIDDLQKFNPESFAKALFDAE